MVICMNQKIVCVLLMFSLCSVLLFTGVRVVSADSTDGITFPSGVYLTSPVNTTYSSRSVMLDLTFGYPLGLQCSINYSIDGEYSGQVPLVAVNDKELHVIVPTIGTVQLPVLTSGSHCLTLYVEDDINDNHGVNAPSAPFKPANPEHTNYAAKWVHTIYFTIISNETIPDITPTNTPSPSAQNTTFPAAVESPAKEVSMLSIEVVLAAFALLIIGEIVYVTAKRKTWK